VTIQPLTQPQRSPLRQVKTADPLTALVAIACRTFPLATVPVGGKFCRNANYNFQIWKKLYISFKIQNLKEK
jgi:hypothetical protein